MYSSKIAIPNKARLLLSNTIERLPQNRNTFTIVQKITKYALVKKITSCCGV